MVARKKPVGTQQDRRPQRSRVSVLPARQQEMDIPSPPAAHGGLLKSSLEAWERFWASTAATAAEEVDQVLAGRWILARDEWQRSLNALRRRRLVQGSTGQPVLNPLATWIASREAVMAKLETQLGIGLKARADIGVAVGQARMTAHELNRMTEEDDGDVEHSDVDEIEAEILEDFTAG